MSTTILTSIKDSLGWITLNRPEVRNALSSELMEEVGDAIAAFESDPSVRALVIAGEGPAFCAGADLRSMRSSRDSSDDANRSDAHRMGGLFHRIASCAKPVLARVHGPAIGGGVGLMAACDIVVAAESTRFQFSEVRLGIVPAVISPFCIRRLGRVTAKRLFLTGEPIDAKTAREHGLVDVVAPDAALDEAVTRITGDLAKAGPNALIAAKALVDTVCGLDGDAALRYTADLIARLRVSDEAVEGMTAFLEKRPAAWVPQK
ncbi:MAG TPA: enoyl-CoA hydratase-related protein [Candidatus Limnocylindrales bacterium]|nr:enoyl-CoA hydratase-related protein [Candidatus Limnocylindrales bacterium]